MNVSDMYANGASLEDVLDRARAEFKAEEIKAEAKKKEEEETRAITDLVNADIRLRNLLGARVTSDMCRILSQKYVTYANSIKNDKALEEKIPSAEQTLKDWLDSLS